MSKNVCVSLDRVGNHINILDDFTEVWSTRGYGQFQDFVWKPKEVVDQLPAYHTSLRRIFEIGNTP
jgi:hypothetical protein